MARVTDVDMAALAEALDEGRPVVVIDVRTSMEFAGGHIPGAVNVPFLGQADWGADLPEGELWLVCKAGSRSRAAADRVAARGRAVTNVRGGMSAWRGPTEGRPTLLSLALPILAVLTLGLAPFSPEPHLLGKLRWIAGGAVGMGPMDWFDVLLHGAPWVWLGWSLVRWLRGRSD